MCALNLHVQCKTYDSCFPMFDAYIKVKERRKRKKLLRQEFAEKKDNREFSVVVCEIPFLSHTHNKFTVYFDN